MSSTPASRPAISPAVLQCWTAYEQAYAIERGKGASHEKAYEQGAMAYRDVMPCLSGLASIRDFIACVAHGMVLQIIPNQDGTKLLYAANVAAGMARRDTNSDHPAQPQTEAKPAATTQPQADAKPATAQAQTAAKPASSTQPQAA